MKTNIQFVKHKKIYFIIAAAFILVGIISMCVRGFYWDVDFAGGTEITYHVDGMDAKSETANFESIAREVLGDKINVAQQAGDSDVIVKSLELDESERTALLEKLGEQYEGITVVGFDSVSGSVSKDLRQSAIISAVVAVALMLVYITIRFQFSSALAAVICLCHDMFIILTFYSLFQIPVSSNVIAVLLTILGYSINATIIVFDRVRENVKLVRNETFEEKVNLSINQTLMRSVNTTITTLLTIGMIYILGVQSIREFAFPLIVGIVAGLYSSVCLSGSLWTLFKKKSTRVK